MIRESFKKEVNNRSSRYYSGQGFLFMNGYYLNQKKTTSTAAKKTRYYLNSAILIHFPLFYSSTRDA
jgi:hypothetical protein